MKKILLLTLCVILILTSIMTFVACDTGEYVYDGVLGSGTIKLKSFKKVEINIDFHEYDENLVYSTSGKYKFLDEDEKGNKPIEIYINDGSKDITIYGHMTKDGYLIINNNLRFMK